MKTTVVAQMTRPLGNENGQLAMDFIFSSVLVLSAAVVIMSICVAFTLVEVMQYVSFSGARAYFAGDQDEATQIKNAVDKMTALMASLPVIGNPENTFIKVSPIVAAARDYKKEYVLKPGQRSNHYGVEISFELKVLNLRIPFISKALSYETTGDDGGPLATVSSLLGREPTFSECKAVMQQAFDAVVEKDAKYQAIRQRGLPAGAFRPILDNGC